MLAYTYQAPGTYRILHTHEDFFNVQYCYWNGWANVTNKRERGGDVYNWETLELAAAYLVGLTNNYAVPLKMHEAMLLVCTEEKDGEAL